MKTSEDIDRLKEKIKTLEDALEKGHRSKPFKTIFSGKPSDRSDCGVSISLLSKLINSSVDGIIAADKTGRLLIFNDAASDIFGHGVEEALSALNIRDLYLEGGAYEVMAKLRSDGYGGSGKLAGYLVNVVNKDGTLVPVRMNASIVFEKEIEIATIGYLRDLRSCLDAGDGLLSSLLPCEDSDSDVSLSAYLSKLGRQLHLYDQQFCVGAIKNELVTVAQVKQALRKQSEIMDKTKVHVPIGRIMIQLGIMTEAQRDAIINMYRMETRRQASHRQSQADSPSSVNSSDEQDIEEIVTLKVSDDRLEATVRIDAKNANSIVLKELLAFIEAQGIGFGLIAESEIQAFLNSGTIPSRDFAIARGTPPVSEKPPEVRFYFSTTPLGVGTTREDGSIDWKNRGRLPQARPGEVLAEITPSRPGTSGMDVFGNEIVPPTEKSALPKCGKGVALSEEGDQYMARINGMVFFSDNKLSLVEAHVVEGDVGLETGHIDFDGHVEVGGSIHKGYRVNCKSLRVDDIHEAEITVAGDMVVTGGIYESTVKCKGSLQVPQIRKSQIRVGGDLVVQKEIMESTIESSGRCLIEDGTIIFSRISARDGVVAGNLGRKGSKPSILFVGIDQRAKRQIRYTKNNLELQKKELDLLSREVEDLEETLQSMDIEKTELSKTLSLHVDRIEAMENQLGMLESGSRESDAHKIRRVIDNLNSEKERIEAHFQSIENDMEKLSSRVFQKHEEIENGKKEIILLEESLAELIAHKATHQQGAVVKVSGSVYSGTTVTGPHASLTIGDDLASLVIHGTKQIDADGNERFVMQMQGLE